MIKYILGLLIILNFPAHTQTTKDINRIFSVYKQELSILENEVRNYNSDTTKSQELLISITNKLNYFQRHKFSLDSGYVIYQFLSKRAILDQILTKKNLKSKRRDQLKASLLDWSNANCHPKSDQFWHSTSSFFSELGNQLNQFYQQGKQIEMNSFETLFIQEYIQITLPQKIIRQQVMIDQVLRDLPKN